MPPSAPVIPRATPVLAQSVVTDHRVPAADTAASPPSKHRRTSTARGLRRNRLSHSLVANLNEGSLAGRHLTGLLAVSPPMVRTFPTTIDGELTRSDPWLERPVAGRQVPPRYVSTGE